MTQKNTGISGGHPQASILEFYSNRSILVTGGTGFIGKVLIEKLLRTCLGINKIYVLVRPKKKENIQERINQMISQTLFDGIRKENKSLFDKVVPVSGDVSEIDLGLNTEDRKILTENVSVIFHSAASVRFNDPLKRAVLLNLRGTREVVRLAQEMKNLKSLVHVSTAYCNIHVKVVEEKIYPPADDWRKIIELAESMEEDNVEVFTEKILGHYPNTYTFTKALAEHVINDHKDSIPVSIFRPTMVIHSMFEPVPGWIDNFNGPVGLLVGRAKGVVQIAYGGLDMKVDYMPVDVTSQAMVIQAWERANLQGPLIWHCSSNGLMDVTQRVLDGYGNDMLKELPFNDVLWLPGRISTNSKLLYLIGAILLHLIPALIIDTGLKLAKKKPILVKLQRKIFVANTAVGHFTTNEWTFKNENFKMGEAKIPESEKATFPPGFEIVGNADPKEYIRKAILGSRHYLLKEDDARLPEAKKQLRRLYWIDLTARSAFLAFVSYLTVNFYAIQMLSILFERGQSLLQ